MQRTQDQRCWPTVLTRGSWHAYVTVTEEGRTRHVRLASHLNKNAIEVQHNPAGLDEPMFAKFAAHAVEFMKGSFPSELSSWRFTVPKCSFSRRIDEAAAGGRERNCSAVEA